MIGDLFGPDARLEMNRTNITRAARPKSTCRIFEMKEFHKKNDFFNLIAANIISFMGPSNQ